MRPSSATIPLSAAWIKRIHDVGIEYVWPGIEPVEAGTCIQQNLLLSAEKQPYQECFGQELYPTLLAKAAYLFYHLTTSHIFENGNQADRVHLPGHVSAAERGVPAADERAAA